MTPTVFNAIAPCGSELRSIINEIVEHTNNLNTTVDEWMQNDEEYSDEIIRIKTLIAYGADIVCSKMGFQNHLQLGLPVLCSIMNHAMSDEDYKEEYFTISDDINFPWISYTDCDDDTIGIECSFASVDEWMHYVDLYHWQMRCSKSQNPKNQNLN